MEKRNKKTSFDKYVEDETKTEREKREQTSIYPSSNQCNVRTLDEDEESAQLEGCRSVPTTAPVKKTYENIDKDLRIVKTYEVNHNKSEHPQTNTVHSYRNSYNKYPSNGFDRTERKWKHDRFDSDHRVDDHYRGNSRYEYKNSNQRGRKPYPANTDIRRDVKMTTFDLNAGPTPTKSNTSVDIENVIEKCEVLSLSNKNVQIKVTDVMHKKTPTKTVVVPNLKYDKTKPNVEKTVQNIEKSVEIVQDRAPSRRSHPYVNNHSQRCDTNMQNQPSSEVQYRQPVFYGANKFRGTNQRYRPRHQNSMYGPTPQQLPPYMYVDPSQLHPQMQPNGPAFDYSYQYGQENYMYGTYQDYPPVQYGYEQYPPNPDYSMPPYTAYMPPPYSNNSYDNYYYDQYNGNWPPSDT